MVHIGKKVSVSIKFVIDGSVYVEHIQGILKEEKSNSFIIEQHIPFSNLFVKDAKTIFIEREVFKNSFESNLKIYWYFFIKSSIEKE